MIIVGELINASRKSVGSAIENNDVEAVKKLALDQAEDGAVPWVIPSVLGRGEAHGWADAATIVPWAVYRHYGDVRILQGGCRRRDQICLC